MSGLLKDPFVFTFFGLIPFLVGILFPSLLIPWIIKKVTRSKVTFECLIIYSLLCSFFAFIANFVWERTVFDVVYHEWDRVFIPFTLFYHETPVNDAVSGSVMLNNWTFNNLTLIWLVFDLVVILLSLIISLLILRKRKEFKASQKILVISSVALVLLGFIVNLSPGAVRMLFLNPIVLLASFNQLF